MVNLEVLWRFYGRCEKCCFSQKVIRIALEVKGKESIKILCICCFGKILMKVIEEEKNDNGEIFEKKGGE